MNTETTIVKNIRTADDKANYDLMTAIMICLGRPENKDYTGFEVVGCTAIYRDKFSREMSDIRVRFSY